MKREQMAPPHDRDRLRRGARAALIALALISVTIAAIALTSDGIVTRLGGVRISIKNPSISIAVAVLSMLAAAVLSTRDERQSALSLSWLRSTMLDGIAQRRARWIAAATALAIVVLGVTRGAFEAGGADGYGYVSQAELWAHGSLYVPRPLAVDPRWHHSIDPLTPFGFRPSQDRQGNVPMYSAGLPILMALFQVVGGRHAVFYVVPLLGGLAVWATFLMGTRLANPIVGTGAAVLMATSPAFLYQLMAPMSDVPIAAWWALAFALLLYSRRWSALAAGAAAGMAVLTRPNLVPIAAILGTWLLWRAIQTGSTRSAGTRQLLLFAAGLVPFCVAVGVFNAYLFGSPWKTGYDSFDRLFSSENLWPNLRRYPRWLLESETPIVLLALLVPAFLRPRSEESSLTDRTAVCWTWWCGIAFLVVTYVFYWVFEAWWFLRFLLAAFPPLLVMTMVAVDEMVRRIVPRYRVVAVAAAVGVVASHGVLYAARNSAFSMKEGERKYSAVGNYVAAHLPERAALISMQHSGSANYYSGRMTVMFESIPGDQLQSVIDDLRTTGYHPYFVLEDWEEPIFRVQFSAGCKCGWLDWPPVAELIHGTRVRIYDPVDRDNPAARRREPDTFFAH